MANPDWRLAPGSNTGCTRNISAKLEYLGSGAGAANTLYENMVRGRA